MLALLDDVSANPAAIRPLTSARWAIGIADLALLGRRAADLGSRWKADRATATWSANGCALACTEGVTLPSSLEALHDPGDPALQPAGPAPVPGDVAEARPACGSTPVSRCRPGPAGDHHAGVEGELAASGSSSVRNWGLHRCRRRLLRRGRRGVLGGLLAYLDAERNHGVGLTRRWRAMRIR